MASWIWQESYCIIACELLELTQYLEYSRILYNVYAFCNRKVHIVIYILYHDMPPCNVRDASHYVRSHVPALIISCVRSTSCISCIRFESPVHTHVVLGSWKPWDAAGKQIVCNAFIPGKGALRISPIMEHGEGSLPHAMREFMDTDTVPKTSVSVQKRHCKKQSNLLTTIF